MTSALRLLPRGIAVVALISLAPRGVQAHELEPNDVFADAQVIAGNASGVANFDAGLQQTPFEPLKDVIYEFHDLLPGQVNHHLFNGWAPGFPVAAYIDNLVGGGEPDTVMRGLDASGNEIEFSDDGSPLGDRFASGFFTTANADGSVRLEVTGFADYDFDGIDDFFLTPHEVSGEYAIVLKSGPFGDVDFYRFVGLAPGTPWSAATEAGPLGFPLDTLLSQYDGGQTLVAQNDNIDPANGNFFSGLSGIVPTGGEVILAVSASVDPTNVGAHRYAGDYIFSFSYQPVPEPSSSTLFAGWLATLALLAAARRPQSRPKLTD